MKDCCVLTKGTQFTIPCYVHVGKIIIPIAVTQILMYHYSKEDDSREYETSNVAGL